MKKPTGNLSLTNSIPGKKIRCVFSRYPQIVVVGGMYFVFANNRDQKGEMGVIISKLNAAGQRTPVIMMSNDLVLPFDWFSVVESP